MTRPSRAVDRRRAARRPAPAAALSAARSGSGSSSTAPHVGSALRTAHTTRVPGGVARELGQLARRGLRRVPGAGEQDRPARPGLGLGGELGQALHDPLGERALARRRDAAVAERVRVPVGAGAVEHDVGVLDGLGAVRPGQQQPKRIAGARTRADLLVLEQALAPDGIDTRVEPQPRRHSRQLPDGLITFTEVVEHERIVQTFEDVENPDNKLVETLTTTLEDAGDGKTRATYHQVGHMPAEQYRLVEEGVGGFYDQLAEQLAR